MKFESLNIKRGPHCSLGWVTTELCGLVVGSTRRGLVVVPAVVGYYRLWVCRPRALLPTTNCYDRPPPKTIHRRPHFRSGNGSILLLNHSNVTGPTLH